MTSPSDGPGGEPPLIEKWVDLMDNALRIPGTDIRIGIDPILGFLFPGIGDSAGALLSVGVFVTALREGVPLPVLMRMLLNIAIDALVGSFPLLGDVFDVAFRANQRNYELVKRHGRGNEPAPPSHYAILILVVAIVLVGLLLPVVLVGMLFGKLLGGG